MVFGKAANQCGYIWSLHENYIDLYPDAPSYDPTARVLQGRRNAIAGVVQRGHQGAELRPEMQPGAWLCQTERPRDPPAIQHYGGLLGRAYLRAAVAPIGSRGRPADGRHGAGQGKVRHRVISVHAGHARRTAVWRRVQSLLLGRPLRRRRSPGPRRRGPCAAGSTSIY